MCTWACTRARTVCTVCTVVFGLAVRRVRVTLPLHYRYITVTSPLHHRYTTVTPPSRYRHGAPLHGAPLHGAPLRLPVAPRLLQYRHITVTLSLRRTERGAESGQEAVGQVVAAQVEQQRCAPVPEAQVVS